MTLHPDQEKEIDQLIELCLQDAEAGCEPVTWPPAPEKGKTAEVLMDTLFAQEANAQARFTLLQGVRNDLHACLDGDPDADPISAIAHARSVLGLPPLKN